MRAPALAITLLTGFSPAAIADTALLDEVIVEASRYNSELSVAGKTLLARREIPASVSVLDGPDEA